MRPFVFQGSIELFFLELAFAAQCRYIVTHNVNDFHGSEQLGIAALLPRDFLKLIRIGK